MTTRIFKTATLVILVGLIISSSLLWFRFLEKSEKDAITMGKLEETIKQLGQDSNPIITPSNSISPIPQSTEISETNDITLSDESTTNKEVVLQVAKNMGRIVDANNLSEVEELLAEFDNLSAEDKIRYGVWGEETNESKVQKLFKQGKTFQEAQLIVDPNGDYWTENKPQEVIQ